ncbi:hypothetical protein G7046_g7435 [Stylonectria norvegica]|nr:hypothetical protein G7046_g7435 [Stylonectria norvegica]
MPPKRLYVEKPSRHAPKGIFGSTYETLTSSENAAVVRSIAVFGLMGRDPAAASVNYSRSVKRRPGRLANHAKQHNTCTLDESAMAAVAAPFAPSEGQTSKNHMRRSRAARSSLAELVSKFEILDAMSAVEQAQPQTVVFTTKIQSYSTPSVHRQSAPKIKHIPAHSFQRTEDSNSTRSSRVSPQDAMSPTRRWFPRQEESPLPETFEQPKQSPGPGRRQKLIAERRKIFEVDTSSTAAPIPMKKGSSARSPTDLPRSKTWQTINSNASARRQSKDDASSTTISPASTICDELYSPTEYKTETGVSKGTSSGQPKKSTSRSLRLSGPLPKMPITPNAGRQGRPSIITRSLAKPQESDAWGFRDFNDRIKSYASLSGSLSRYKGAEQPTPSLSRGYTKSVGKSTTRLIDEKTSPGSDIRRSDWVESLQAGHPLLVTKGDKDLGNEYRNQSYQQQAQYDPNGSRTSELLSRGNSNPVLTSKIPRSRISSLRQRFDLTRGVPHTLATFSGKKRRDTTPAEEKLSTWKPRLQKSATTPALGGLGFLRQKTRSHETAEGLSKQRVYSVKETSPLREKIGLFESLSRQGLDGETSSCSPKAASSDRPLLSEYRRKLSGMGKSNHMKGALRRLSASWKRRSSERSSGSQQDSLLLGCNDTRDTWWVKRDSVATSKAAARRMPPSSGRLRSHATSSDGRETPRQAFPQGDPSSPRERKHGNRQSDHSSLAAQGMNVNGESGLRISTRGSPSKASLSERRLYQKATCVIHPLGVEEEFVSRRFSISESVRDEVELTRAQTRRRISRSGGPFVAKSYCALEQPKPIRANELKRLVSLCKEKVVRRISSGHGD